MRWIRPEGDVAAAHFDSVTVSEEFQSGQNRLAELRALVADHILNQNYARARIATGRLLHTLQDFLQPLQLD